MEQSRRGPERERRKTKVVEDNDTLMRKRNICLMTPNFIIASCLNRSFNLALPHDAYSL